MLHHSTWAQMLEGALNIRHQSMALASVQDFINHHSLSISLCQPCIKQSATPFCYGCFYELS